MNTNAIGIVFLAIYSLVIVIQLLTMIYHRLSTLCHLLARAPWTRGPYMLSWAFKDEDLQPEPTQEDLDLIRQKKNRRTKRRTGNSHL